MHHTSPPPSKQVIHPALAPRNQLPHHTYCARAISLLGTYTYTLLPPAHHIITSPSPSAQKTLTDKPPKITENELLRLFLLVVLHAVLHPAIPDLVPLVLQLWRVSGRRGTTAQTVVGRQRAVNGRVPPRLYAGGGGGQEGADGVFDAGYGGVWAFLGHCPWLLGVGVGGIDGLSGGILDVSPFTTVGVIFPTCADGGAGTASPLGIRAYHGATLSAFPA